MQATIAGVKISPATLAQTIALIEDGTISSKIAKELAPELLEGAAEAAGVAALVEERGMGQISDDAAILAMIDEAIAGNPKQLEQYRCAPPPAATLQCRRSCALQPPRHGSLGALRRALRWQY